MTIKTPKRFNLFKVIIDNLTKKMYFRHLLTIFC